MSRRTGSLPGPVTAQQMNSLIVGVSEPTLRIFQAGIIAAQLHWSTEPPTEPGWYWVKDKHSTRVAEVALEYGLLNVYVTGVETDCSLSAFTHFAGPIPEPKE